MTDKVANELKTLADLLQGAPLLVGQKSGTKILEDDVVYDRFGIQVITATTLTDHLLDGVPLELHAGPGGPYVNMDQKKISEYRQEQNLSLGSFARSLKVTRRTVQMYEDGMNASIEVALRIEDLLGTNVTVPIDILRYKPQIKKQSQTPTFETESFKKFQRDIFSILEKVGYRVIPMERCPFEAVSQDKKKILLTCVDQYDKKLLKKAQVVSSISKITEKHAVLITDKDTSKTNIEGTPLIVKKELKKLGSPEDILDLILERLYRKGEK